MEREVNTLRVESFNETVALVASSHTFIRTTISNYILNSLQN